MRCMKCGNTIDNNGICSICGYDITRDYIHLRTISHVNNQEEDPEKESMYNEACRFEQEGKFSWAFSIFRRLRNYKDSEIRRDYNFACNLELLQEYMLSIYRFNKLGNYRDCKKRIENCLSKLIEIELEEKYKEAINYQRKSEKLNDYAFIRAQLLFDSLDGYKESRKNFEKMQSELLEFGYQEALKFKNKGDYQQAYIRFKNLNDYKDSVAKMEECQKKM